MEFSTTVHIDAPPDDVWRILADVSTWPRWTSSMRSVEPISDGPLAVGKRVRVHQPRLAPMTWTVTELDPQRSFVWEGRTPGIRVVAGHVLNAEHDGTTTVDLSIHQDGTLAPLVERLTKHVTARYLRTEAEGLRRASERSRSHLGLADDVEPFALPPEPPPDPVERALRVDARVLAAIFALSGSAKLFASKEQLSQVPLGGWTEDASAGAIKTLGVLEAAAAIGLVLPPAVDVAPVLVPIDAACLIALMIGAATTHFRRHEPLGVALNLTYLGMAAFLAWGRFGRHALRS
jgi:uncharacterized protein YndB with AHSA1/START domain